MPESSLDEGVVVAEAVVIFVVAELFLPPISSASSPIDSSANDSSDEYRRPLFLFAGVFLLTLRPTFVL